MKLLPRRPFCLLPLLLPGFTTLALAQTGATEARPRLAVLPLAGNNVPAHVPKALDDLLAVEIGNSQRFEVIATGEIQTMLGLEEMKQAVGCDDTGCIAEIGGALDVTYVVSGKVSRLGEQFHVTLTMSDVKSARVVARALETVAADESLLASAAQRAVAKLLNAQLGPAAAGMAPIAASAEASTRATAAAGTDKEPASPWTAALTGGGLVAGAGCVGGTAGILLAMVLAFGEYDQPPDWIWQLGSPSMLLCGGSAGMLAATAPTLLSGEFFSGLEQIGLIVIPASVGALLGGGFGLLWVNGVMLSSDALDYIGMNKDESIGAYAVFGFPLVIVSSILGGATFAGLALFWGDGDEAREAAVEP